MSDLPTWEGERPTVAELEEMYPASDCILWDGSLSPKGYGRISIKGKFFRAHRVIYEEVHGPIPEGLVIDHLCRSHSCVNVAHMEVVTNRENVLRGVGITAGFARQKHCKRGHPFDEANTRRYRGARVCRRCKRLRNRIHSGAATQAEREEYEAGE